YLAAAGRCSDRGGRRVLLLWLAVLFAFACSQVARHAWRWLPVCGLSCASFAMEFARATSVALSFWLVWFVGRDVFRLILSDFRDGRVHLFLVWVWLLVLLMVWGGALRMHWAWLFSAALRVGLL
ncbi:hypothetical protein, partial [Ralstonia sp. ASV6]|uniref:hypothetical protein n=1 Tax=Ralstonia sp. ASV6 TaxID=2795124 RepID=UPI001E55165D